jgi:hypothetical protein
MNEILTRPIPEFAVEAIKEGRVAEVIRTAELQRTEQIGLQSNKLDFDNDTLIAVRSSNQSASYWRRACDAAAAAATLTLLGQSLSTPLPPTTSRFLSIVSDRGVSRPMLDMSEVTTSRAAASMQSMDLSEADANVIKQALATGSSRPRIKIAVLPQYQG